jgi:hypothetical protein
VSVLALSTAAGALDIAGAVLTIAASRSNATASPRNSAGARCARSDVLTKYSVPRWSTASASRRVSQQDQESARPELIATVTRSSRCT